MTDNPAGAEPATSPSLSAPPLPPTPVAEPRPATPVAGGNGGRRGRWLRRGRAGDDGGGGGSRPLAVYGVLLAGLAVLGILLAIIWFTAGGDSGKDRPTCLNIQPDPAVAAVRRGDVERVRITYAKNQPGLGPLALRLDQTDGNCYNLQPQGVLGQAAVLYVTGAVAFYNQITDQRKITVVYDGSDKLPPDLLANPTSTPTVTPPNVPTPTLALASPSPIAAAPTVTATATVTSVASPATPPTFTPIAAATETATESTPANPATPGAIAPGVGPVTATVTPLP